MSDSIRHKTVAGMLWASLQRFGTMIISFGSNIVLARLLTPEDFGCIGMLAIFLALANTFIDGGFGSALIQKTVPDEDDYNTVFVWNLLMSAALYIILFLSAPAIAAFYNMPVLSDVLRVVGLTLIINALYIVQMNILRKRMQFKKIAAINITSAVISVTAAIITAFQGYGVWALVIQQLCYSVCCLAMALLTTNWKPHLKAKRQSLNELFSFGGYMLASSLLNTFSNNLSGLLIGKGFQASTLGYFIQARKVEDISSTSLTAVVDQVTYPMLVEVKDNRNRFINVIDRATAMLLACGMPLMFLIALLSKPIVLLLFGDQWLPSAHILEILAIQGVFIWMQGVNYNAIAALGKSRTLFRWNIFKRTISISLMLLTVLTHKLDYLLWAMTFNAAFSAFCNSYILGKALDYSVLRQIKYQMPTILSTTVPFILCFFITHCYPQHTYLPFFISLLYVCIYVSLIFILKLPMLNEIKPYLIKIYTRVSKR